MTIVLRFTAFSIEFASRNSFAIISFTGRRFILEKKIIKKGEAPLRNNDFVEI